MARRFLRLGGRHKCGDGTGFRPHVYALSRSNCPIQLLGRRTQPAERWRDSTVGDVRQDAAVDEARIGRQLRRVVAVLGIDSRTGQRRIGDARPMDVRRPGHRRRIGPRRTRPRPDHRRSRRPDHLCRSRIRRPPGSRARLVFAVVLDRNAQRCQSGSASAGRHVVQVGSQRQRLRQQPARQEYHADRQGRRR
jgi:hypothetical protein